MTKLDSSFFQRDVLQVAPDLIGKNLHVVNNQTELAYQITEVEAYRGEEDLACHASKGRTSRTRIMYDEGGTIYVYLIYGMYWMLNVVTGKKDHPQAALIRGIEGYPGPGKLTRALGIDKSYYGESLVLSPRIFITESFQKVSFTTSPRIGIDYAGEYWKNKPWRFTLS